VLVNVSPLGTGGRCYFVNGSVLLAGCDVVGAAGKAGDAGAGKGRDQERYVWA